jgi:hypothetical protein
VSTDRTAEGEPDSALVPLRKEDGRPIVHAGFVRGLRVVAEAVFATASGAPPADRMDWLALELEDFLARAGSQTRLTLRLALLAISFLAPLLVLRFTSLSRMPVAERARAIGRLEHSSLGAPVLAIKALLCVLYYEHPDAAEEIGFDGQCLLPGPGGPQHAR